MPEPAAVTPMPASRQAAFQAVRAWVDCLPSARVLESHELRAYGSRQAIAGWRLDVVFDRMRRIDLIIVDGFPRRPPRIALVDRPEFLTWPHLDEDGVFCLLGDTAEVDFSRPLEVIQNQLAEASDLIMSLVAGEGMEDFRGEFHSYWNRSVDARAPTIYSLLTPEPPTRLARVWRGRSFYLLGEEAVITAWLDNRFPNGGRWTTEPVPVLWLERALLPSEFPRRPADVMALARQCGGDEMLRQLATEESGDLLTVIAANTSNGPCLAAVTLIPQSRSGNHQTTPGATIPGFRPGKAPRQLLIQRRYGGGAVVRAAVERADSAWVHGRGQDTRHDRLRNATIAVLGCGSLGAAIALQLVGAGVGSLVLIDPQMLTFANVGRHPLGAAGVGRGKALALAEKIRSDYPHILSVRAITSRWEQVGADLETLASCDLIVSAIGDWAAEAALNEWHRANRQGPIVYGWTEAHACAGHAVAIIRPGGCLQCGFTNSGIPSCQVTDWPNGNTLKQEPACGTSFQPYGVVELGHIISVVAEMTLDCVLGAVKESTCRTWVGPRSLLESAGGRWTDSWLTIAGGRLKGGFIEERAWPLSHSCIECGAKAA